MAHPRPFITGIIVGRSGGSGKACLRGWPQPAPFLSNCPSIARTSKPIARPKAQRGGAWSQAIGTSPGGRTSKIHVLADDRGRLIAFILTPGNIADITMAIPLLKAVAHPKRLLADSAYDADSLRNSLKNARVKAVIPSTAACKTPYPLDWNA